MSPPMLQAQTVLARLRPFAGLVLLGLFLLAAQLAPLSHLASHRNDHTHGPELGTGTATTPTGHEAAHRSGLAHQHDAVPTAAEAPDAHDEDGAPPDQTPADAPAPDHGRGSSAHLGLALLEAPRALFLPPPAQLAALTPDAPLHDHAAPPRRQPRARGPPDLD